MNNKNFFFAVAVGLGFAASGQAGSFTIFASETPAGTLGGNTAAYGGVRQYGFTGTGSAATPGAGLPAASLNDPGGLAFFNNKLFISNRHGNSLGLGSVQRADFDGITLGNVTTVATNPTASDAGFHGIGFGSNGDLFVTTVNNGTIRYRDSGSGFAKIAQTANGPVRDAWITPDGTKLFETTTGNTIKVTTLTGSGFGSSSSFVVNGSNAMHQMSYKNGGLYVTSFNSSTIHRVELNASYDPVSSTTVAGVSGALGIAFSPDGQEMFVGRHGVGDISRLQWNGSSWADGGLIQTGKSMGYLQTVPEPGTMLAIGAGIGLLARRRRQR